MFFKLIRKNGKDSYKENGIYFLSLVIVIIAFYVILSLEKQDVMMFLKEMESDAVGRLFLMIKGVYGISLFMIFFMVYFAQRYQLQRRNHEFGMLMMLGMPRGRLFGMLMVEDLYTSAVSLICGLPIAIVLSECISLITAKLVGMGIIGHHFSLSPTAIGVTAIGFFVIKLVANLILSAKIVRKEPGVLMREQVEQTYKNVKWVREILGIVVGCGCLIAAYGIVLTSGIVFYQLKWMAIVIILGTFGTYWALKGICLFVRVILVKSRKKPVLHTFTFRQLQENVFGKCMPLTIASLLVLMAIICMAYGISVSVSQAHKYEHGMDYTFAAYDEDSEKEILALQKDTSVADVIGKWVPVPVSVLPSVCYQSDEKRKTVVYDGLNLQECAENLSEQDWADFENTSFYYGIFTGGSGYLSEPYMIRLSDWNALQKAKGKETLSLRDDQIALYTDPEFMQDDVAAIYQKIVEQKPYITINGNRYEFIDTICSDDVVVDRSITIGYGWVVPDALYESYADKKNETTYWNAYLRKDLIEKNGLMQAIRIGNTLFDTKGMDYENYLQNIGRQVFYIVAASYLTIYFAFIFLLIANTVISLQFLMQEKRTRSRYRTLIRLGSRYEHLCRSARSQIRWYFAMPVGLAVISSIVGTRVLLKTMLPSILIGKTAWLMGIAGAVILVLVVVECIYMRQVVKLSRQNINQMMDVVREDC